MFNFNPYVKLAAEWEVSEFFLISAWSVWQRTVRRPQRLMAEKKEKKRKSSLGGAAPSFAAVGPHVYWEISFCLAT